MDEQRARFVQGAVEKGVDRKIADLVFDQVAKFAGYGFNKSHAAPYAFISYQTAYLKANFGVEFLACTMTHDRHNTDKLSVYVSELKRMDITLLPPDINASQDTFTVENGAVRYALSGLKGVGADSVVHIMEERKNGKFQDIFDFAKRIDPKSFNKKLMESLIQGGAFDQIHPNRAEFQKKNNPIN
jgi:DNA polymerase-3 subunit alpha